MIDGGGKRGNTFSHPDTLIAATAAQHGLTVVTRNTRQFAAPGVPLFDPWQESI